MPFVDFDKKSENFNEDCDSCHNPILQTQSYFKCDYCYKCFHCHCKLIYGSHIKRLAQKKRWKCSDNCRGTPKQYKGRTSPNNMADNTSNSNNSDASNTIVSSSSLNELHILIKQINENMMKRFCDIQESQEFISTQFDEFKTQMKNVIQENKTMKNAIIILKSKQDKYENIINKIEATIGNQSQEHLSNNIIVAGIPYTNENPSTIINTIFDQLKITAETKKEIHEIKYMENKKITTTNSIQLPRFIIIKFKTLNAKQEVLKKKKDKQTLTVRQLGIFEENHHQMRDNLIFFRDQLTPFKLQLFREAKLLKMKHDIKFLWIKNSKLFMRKTDTSKIFTINSRNDLITIDKHHSVLEENFIHHNTSVHDSSFVSAIS